MSATALVGAISGCTIDGTPTADPAPAPTTTTTDYPSTAETSKPAEVPPPADALTIACRDYPARDDATQVAIVKANGVTKNPRLVATLVGILCLQHPDSTVNAVVNSMRDDIIHN